MTRDHSAVFFAVLAGLTVGCGGPRVDRPDAELEVWTLEETLLVGSLEDPERSLTQVVGPALGPDGRVYVGQPIERLVRVFGPDGSPLPVVGGAGDGPGEFGAAIVVLLMQGDSLVVVDFHGELEFFAPSGEPLKSERFRALEAGRPAPTIVTGILPDGSVFATRALAPGDPLVLLHLERGGELIDTLFVGRGRQIAHQPGPASVWLEPPFSSGSLMVGDAPRGRVIEVGQDIAAETGEATFRVTARYASGDTAYSRDYQYDPVQISSAAVDREVGRAASRLGAVEPDSARAIAFVRRVTEIPTHYPAITRVLVSDEGMLWLEVGGPSDLERTWRVHDEEGSPIAEVGVPPGVELRLVGSRDAWAVYQDDWDVRYLVRFRVKTD